MQSTSKIPENNCRQKAEAHSIFTDVITSIAASSTRITSAALEKRIRERHGLNKRQIKSVIRDLVFSGEVAYTYELGSTFLERSFARPVRISEHVILTPPGRCRRADANDVIVQIKPGASFGAGRHPTTRLAIKAIEFLLLGKPEIEMQKPGSVLDIGTGSGVLILSAVLCGMKLGLGIDTDPCARVEAAENIRINGLQDRILISAQPVETIDRRFSMIMANLRYPSLYKLCGKLTELTNKEGILILSGIKNDEMDDLLAVYTKNEFKCLWQRAELDWACVVIQKPA